jgi:GNAT superfamily N-acetyltransferase
MEKDFLMKIVITKSQSENREELKTFFKIIITDTFKNDDIKFSEADIVKQTQYQLSILDKSLNSHDGIFLIAKDNNKIIGTIAITHPNELITENLSEDLTNVPEIASVYVLPEYQGKGVGSLLFQAAIKHLQEKDINAFVLDSPFKRAQQFWTKKLGLPIVILKNYWAKGKDHLIWYCKVKSFE